MDKVIFILFFISGLQMACGLTDQEYKKRLIIWNTTQRGKHSCIDGELDVYRDLAILPKTIYSEQKRVVFFAGYVRVRTCIFGDFVFLLYVDSTTPFSKDE